MNIEEKVVRIVTDNASNNLSAFQELVIPGFEVYFEPEDDEERDDEPDATNNGVTNVEGAVDNSDERLRIPCFSHTLQLVVGDGLRDSEAAKGALSKVAAIAKLR